LEESNGEEHEPESRRPSNIRRASVCAEKLCAVRVGSEIVKRIPKSEEELEKIHGILIQCVLFEHLDESQLQTVKDAMFPVTKEEEDIIIKQGDAGDNFYVIESGAVDVFTTHQFWSILTMMGIHLVSWPSCIMLPEQQRALQRVDKSNCGLSTDRLSKLF